MKAAFATPVALPSGRQAAHITSKNPVRRFIPARFPVRIEQPHHCETGTVLPQAAKVSASLASHLQVSAAVTFLYQAVFYAISTCFKTERLVDLAGTSNIALLALLSLYLSRSPSIRHVLVSIAIVVWALRLGTFLARRISVWKNDRRFAVIRSGPMRWARFWFIQGVWVWVTSLPATTLGTASVIPLAWSDLPAAVVFLLGLIVETVADAQKDGSRTRKGWPEKGLWRLSRHPNYFGEMLIWWGIYLAAAPALQGAGRVAILSPLLVMLLLLFLTGINLLEKSADKKYGGDPEYSMYKSHTSVLVPFPPRLYERLPTFAKRRLFLDLAIYNSIPENEG